MLYKPFQCPFHTHFFVINVKTLDAHFDWCKLTPDFMHKFRCVTFFKQGRKNLQMRSSHNDLCRDLNNQNVLIGFGFERKAVLNPGVGYSVFEEA